MITVFIQTFSVGWIKGVALTSQDQLMLRLDLIRVMTAGRMLDTHSLIVHVEDKIVLAHQSASNQHL